MVAGYLRRMTKPWPISVRSSATAPPRQAGGSLSKSSRLKAPSSWNAPPAAASSPVATPANRRMTTSAWSPTASSNASSLPRKVCATQTRALDQYSSAGVSACTIARVQTRMGLSESIRPTCCVREQTRAGADMSELCSGGGAVELQRSKLYCRRPLLGWSCGPGPVGLRRRNSG